MTKEDEVVGSNENAVHKSYPTFIVTDAVSRVGSIVDMNVPSLTQAGKPTSTHTSLKFGCRSACQRGCSRVNNSTSSTGKRKGSSPSTHSNSSTPLLTPKHHKAK